MIDITKVKRTMDGREVLEIFHYPENDTGETIVAHVKGRAGSVYAFTYYDSGKVFEGEDHRNDLIEEKPRVTGWVNVYGDEDGIEMNVLFDTKQAAQDFSKGHSCLLGQIYIDAEIQE